MFCVLHVLICFLCVGCMLLLLVWFLCCCLRVQLLFAVVNVLCGVLWCVMFYDCVFTKAVLLCVCFLNMYVAFVWG